MKRYCYIAALAITLYSLVFTGAGKYIRVTESRASGNNPVVRVAFTARDPAIELEEIEIASMVDHVTRQTLGEDRWSALCKPGDRVVIKVNLVGPHRGAEGEKGVGIITDARVVRAVAAGVRQAIGPDGDIIVTDTVFYRHENPSLKNEPTSFFHATGYDTDGDTFLDGGSKARLVNAESYGEDRRFPTTVQEPVLGKTAIWLPDFMRPPEEPSASGEYSDVVIYLPVFKSHGFTGITGALKLGYGLRSGKNLPGDSGRSKHSGYGWGTGNKQLLLDYLCAQMKARPCDFVLLDALTANRKGPLNISELSINRKTDWIRTNALFASTDPVAMDTVETLFAGYDPSSIELLATAASDGLGTDTIANIVITGGNAFGKHRARVSECYPPKASFFRKATYGKGSGSWPLDDGWGGAKIRVDLKSPEFESISLCEEKEESLKIRWKATDPGYGKNGIVRADLVCGEQIINSVQNDANESSFVFSPKTDRSYRLLLWDASLNATEHVFHPDNNLTQPAEENQ